MPTKRKWTRIAGRLWRLTLIPALCLPAVSAWAGNFVFLTIGGRAGGGATGINSHNDVVGAISTGGATSAGFYWHRGVLKEFSPPQGTRTILYAINKHGLTAGVTTIGTNEEVFT